MGSMNAMRTGAPYPVQSGAGNGIFYLHDADSLGVVAPSVDVSQAVALFASDRDSPAGNPDVTGLLVKSENGGKSWIGDRIGINVSYTGTDPDLTTSIDASLHIRGEGTTNATSSLIINDSGTNVNFEVKDDGTVVIPNIGSTTPVTNLGVDSIGNVVSGTTGGDVFKVGTPANNELGVWTGDGTIEGDSNLTWSGSILDINGDTIVSGNVKVNGQSYSSKQTTKYTPPGAFQIDWDLGNVAVVDLGSASGTISVGFSNHKAGASYIIKVIQHDTIPADLDWSTNIKFPGGTAPIISTGADAIDVITLTCISSTELLGNFSQDYQVT